MYYLWVMRTISTTDLRANLAKILMDVLDGETLCVVRGSSTVAYLVAPREWDEMNGVTGQALMDVTGQGRHPVAAAISALCREWGARRVVAEGHERTEQTVLVRAAAEEIARRLAAGKEGG
jgi:antitoxin (DNA-binding transcriptional repressor) of toxin-antitoxin stability system